MENERKEIDIIEMLESEMQLDTFDRILMTLCLIDDNKRYIDLLKSANNLDSLCQIKLNNFLELKKELGHNPQIRTLLNKNNMNINAINKSKLLNEKELDDEIALLIFESNKTELLKVIDTFRESIEEANITGEELIEIETYLSNLVKTDYNDGFEDLKKEYANNQKLITFSTGIKELDRKDYYFVKGGVNTIMGFTGTFKTTMCINVAYHAMMMKQNVAYISLEVNKHDMYFNFLSRHSYSKKFNKKIPHYEMKYGKLSTEEYDYLFNYIYPDFNGNLKQHLMVIDESNIASNSFAVYNKLLRDVNNSFIQKTGKGIDLLIVDHLQLLKYNTDMDNTNPTYLVNKWMNYFRRNSQNFLNTKTEIGVITVAQSNRKGYEEAKKRDGVYLDSSSADSAEIERSSTVHISLFSDNCSASVGNIKIQVIKYRDLPRRYETLSVPIDPKYCCMSNVEEVDVDEILKLSAREIIKQEQDIFNNTKEAIDDIDLLEELINPPAPEISFD